MRTWSGTKAGHDHSDLQACVSILLANSEIKEFEIAELAQNWLDNGTEHYVTWLAVLVSVTPTVGISKIKEKISSFPNQELKTKFAMQFVVELMGGRHSKRTNYRTIFETPDHLENLYLLMNKHIPMSDDINRANTGGYTPKLRDEAQEARGALLMKIVNIPGKKSYLALKSLAKKHPHEEAREWMKKRVLDHAEKQADLAPMSVEDIHCFHNQFENTPASTKELFFIAKLRLNLLKVELEDGEDSPASSWQKEDKETNLRVLIAKWLRDKSNSMYSIHQEEEQTDGKRPDIRFSGLGFDAPVPVELKISGNWTGPQLFERLENQLCNDYLRDYRTNHGVFLLVNRKGNKHWLHPKSKKKMAFEDLIQTLSKHAKKYIENKEGIENIHVLGIDLTKRNIEERIK